VVNDLGACFGLGLCFDEDIFFDFLLFFGFDLVLNLFLIKFLMKKIMSYFGKMCYLCLKFCFFENILSFCLRNLIFFEKRLPSLKFSNFYKK
jgi:hypothetical protein